ncbi:2Fe-2S iron-sulfur cluster-binding protein [Brevibacillus daliensis]|uniref:2Fe-2S iron-sulfur cluster-binding protein n=1 Tax=Brevibacillus daliensis TaxID=2892995 RepID=UPI001E47A672|nr:2Fe-2S iron-sulfur cluster-binding protein [Brevibacillus daliensis]
MDQITLITKIGESYHIPVEQHTSIVELAKKNKIPWGYACQRGICAQCRTRVTEGREFLNDITPEEKLRLKKAERREHIRLGCQIKLIGEGSVQLVHTPYM